MASRSAIVCFLAAMLAAGCNRTDAPPRAAAAIAPKAATPASRGPKGDRLAKPVPLEIDGKRLTSDVHSFVPFVGDLDGDGRQDLLLGTRDMGKLLVYRNVGAKTSPRLVGPKWFDDTVPTGSIPGG